jgi:hypothetical protein
MSPAWEVFRPFTVFPGDFLIRKCVGKFKMFPKNVPSVPGWIVQSVLYDVPNEVTIVYPASKIQNAQERCNQNVPEWYIQNVLENAPIMYFFRKILGTLWEHCK